MTAIEPIKAASEMTSLKNRVAFATGAGSGIGRAGARAMARCGPGDVLVVEAHTFDEYSCTMGNMKTRMLWHQKAEERNTNENTRIGKFEVLQKTA